MVTFPLSKRLCTFGSVISRHHHPQVIAMKLLVVFIIVTLMAAYCQAQVNLASLLGFGGGGGLFQRPSRKLIRRNQDLLLQSLLGRSSGMGLGSLLGGGQQTAPQQQPLTLQQLAPAMLLSNMNFQNRMMRDIF
ncbi:uncharacterized protein LOC124131135 isoform X2 [Haliotis rufescens]|uniref:uncharacterized protein LOC124131135 isoform X2 n=1 Tax=Haliotis rufescens TaxID=6454 RepID=UPI00201FAC0F|nr:uncharacterized protein LOC124131135 isoform X2 [Haliotis rufescens]